MLPTILIITAQLSLAHIRILIPLQRLARFTTFSQSCQFLVGPVALINPSGFTRKTLILALRAYYSRSISTTVKQFFGAPVQSPSPQMTDLSSIFQAMPIQSPPDSNYYMDPSANSHISFNQCNMLFFTPCNPKSTMVDNGILLPVIQIDHTFSSFC